MLLQKIELFREKRIENQLLQEENTTATRGENSCFKWREQSQCKGKRKELLQALFPPIAIFTGGKAVRDNGAPSFFFHRAALSFCVSLHGSSYPLYLSIFMSLPFVLLLIFHPPPPMLNRELSLQGQSSKMKNHDVELNHVVVGESQLQHTYLRRSTHISALADISPLQQTYTCCSRLDILPLQQTYVSLLQQTYLCFSRHFSVVADISPL